MKFNLTPTITLEELANKIRLQYDVEPAELIDEFNMLGEFPYQLHYDKLTQDKWRACRRDGEGVIYTQLLLAASICKDIFREWTYCFIIK